MIKDSMLSQHINQLVEKSSKFQERERERGSGKTRCLAAVERGGEGGKIGRR